MNIFKALISVLIITNSLFASKPIFQNEDIPNGLHLIVGSPRTKGNSSFWWEKITGPGKDFTHRDTFEGKAVSLDIWPSCADPMLPHIQADARTFIPPSKINTVYMELFPSIDLQALGITKSGDSWEDQVKTMKSMPEAIQNLAQYMNPKAKLEIEHIPHLTRFLDENFYVKVVEHLRKENPFHCFLSPLFMENLEARNHIGVNNKVKYWSQIRQECLEIRKWSLEDINVIISGALQDHPALLKAISNIQKLLGIDSDAMEKRLKADFNNYLKNPSLFVTESLNYLSTVIAQEFTMLNQQDLMRSFLENNGFQNVNIQRRDTTINGRRNVWIISGQYKSA